MLAKISLTCFAASYLVALLLEATRMWFRSGLRGALMLGFAAAGVLAHTLYLAHRAVTAGGAPLSSEHDWYLLAAWALAGVYFGWTFRQLRAPNERRTAVGLFLLPLVLGLVGLAHFAASSTTVAKEQASGIWLTIHLLCLAAGMVSVLVGFAVGIMELVQAFRLKHKISPQRGLRLPSLEWLEHAGVRSIFTSFGLLAAGLLSGTILNFVNGVLPWSDPTVWRLAVVVVWLGTAATFLIVYKPARQGRKVAYIGITTAVVALVSLGLGLVLPGDHGARMKKRNDEVGMMNDERRSPIEHSFIIHPSSFIISTSRNRVASCAVPADHGASS